MPYEGVGREVNAGDGDLVSLTKSLRMSSCSLSMTRALTGTGVSLHPGKAALAEETADSNSAEVQTGTRDTTSWVA